MTHVENPTGHNNIILVSPVILSGITLRPHVDHYVTSPLTLADSNMMTQLCRHNWAVKTLQQCTELLATPTISYIAGQYTVRWWLRRITCAVDDNAICHWQRFASQHARWREHLVKLPNLRNVETKACSVWGINDFGWRSEARSRRADWHESLCIDTSTSIGIPGRHAVIYVGIVSVCRWFNLWCNAE